MERKGIILAGGANTRLYPITHVVAKSLLPVYDKPMIYYPLSTLMLAGIRDILVITTPHGAAVHERLLGDGAQFGIRLSYQQQAAPRGIADALLIGRDFVGENPCALILSDNIFYGGNFVNQLRAAAADEKATVFAYQVPDPSRFGVIEFDAAGRALSLEEKPAQPKSNFAVTGCYFYDNRAAELTAGLTPSSRGELEITDLNCEYLQRDSLSVQKMGRGLAWFDTGTPASLAEAGDFVRVIQSRQGLMISCPEEIGWRSGWLEESDILAQAGKLKNTPYGDYLGELIKK